MTSSRDTTKSRGRPATGKGTPVTVRMQPPHLAALDAYIATMPAPRPTRPEAMRQALADHLRAKGYLPADHHIDGTG